MEHIDTYFVMKELQHRLHDAVYNADICTDPVLNTLREQTDDNVNTMKRMDRELRILLSRYHNLLHNRVHGIEEQA